MQDNGRRVLRPADLLTKITGFKLKMISVVVALSYIALSVPGAEGRGRLMEPTQRSSLWSRGFDSPENHDDSGLNCGGKWVQHGLNGGRCGVCGDPFDAQPRPNEPGGLYANGIIANRYNTEDMSMPVVVDITSYLGGYFEFRICPHNNPQVTVTQDCLDQHPLKVWDVMDKQAGYRYYPSSVGMQRLRVEIPEGMICEQCVLQWKWHTASDWGHCSDGTSRKGCGVQEEFYNCADIAIEPAPLRSSNPNVLDLSMLSPAPSRSSIPDVLELSKLSPPTSQNFAVPADSPMAEMGTGNDQVVPSGVPIQTQDNVNHAPISFLPPDALLSGNFGPVIPKFDFFDPAMVMKSARETSSSSTTASTTTTIYPTTKASTTTIPTPTPTVASTTTTTEKANVVELKFNGENITVANNANTSLNMNTAVEVNTEPVVAMEYQSSPVVDHTDVDVSVTKLADVEPTLGTFLDTNASSVSAESTAVVANQTVADIAFSEVDSIPSLQEQTSFIEQATTSVANTTDQANMKTEGNNNTTDIVSTNAETGPETVEPLVTAVDGAVNQAQSETEMTSTVEEVATLKDIKRGGVAINSYGMGDARFGGMTVKVGMGADSKSLTNESPVDLPAASSVSNTPDAVLRVRRQAGPPPPPIAPVPAKSKSSSHGPTPVSFGGLIGDSFSQGGSKTQHSFMSMADFQQSMGGGVGQPDPSNIEALGETGGARMERGRVVGMIDGQGYPQDMMLQPNEPGQILQGGMLEAMLTDPKPAGPRSAADPSQLIPKPPRQSNAELEAAIADAPMISSAVSDTSVSNNPADLLGASYIPELSEGQSNQAETSTAARHGTMIVKAESGVTQGRGSNVEYLAGSKGTSMGESSFDTQADIRSASGSLSRFGYQPTAEQMLSGQANLDHPTRNLDTTDLEAVGSSPADAASSMPSILSSILGAGAQPSVTDAQLDPAEQKSREQLIRQLGEAMGVIGDNPLSPGASTGKPKGAPNKAQQQQQSVAIAFGESSMTGTMDFLKPQNQQGQFTDGSLMSNTPGQQQEQTIGGLDQSMFGQDLNMFGYDMNTAQTEPDIPPKQQMTKPQPTKPESPKSPQASELEKLLQGTGLDMTSLQAVGISIEDLIGAPSQSQPTTSTTTKPTMKPATTPAPIETPVDIGMAGMTLEHMMTILNMEQQSKGLGASTEPSGTLSDPLYPAQLGKAAPPNPTQQVVEVRPDSAQVGDFSSQSIEPNLTGLPEQTKTYDSQNQPLQNAQNLNFKQGMFDVIETKTKVIDGPSRTDASLKSDRTNTQGHNPDKVTMKTLQYPPISGTQYPPLPETHYSPVDKPNPFETILLEATNTGPVIERKGNSGSGSSSSSMSQASSQSSMNFMGMFGGLSDGSNQGKGTNPGPEAFAQSGPSSLTAEQLDAYMTGSLGMTNTGQLPSLTGNAQIETMLETSSSTKATEPSYTAPSGIMADVATNGTASLEFTQQELAAMENDPLLGLFGGDLGALQNFINHGVIDQMGDQGMGVGASKLQGSSQVTVESNTQTGAGSFLQNTSEQMDSQGTQGTLGDAAMDQYLQPSMSGAQDSTAASQQSASSATQAAQNEMMALEQFMAANADGNANNAFAPMQGQGYQGNQNIDMAAMQQFLTAQGMMGANPQPEPPQTDYGTFMGNFQQSGMDMGAQSPTISLADLLSGNVNMLGGPTFESQTPSASQNVATSQQSTTDMSYTSGPSSFGQSETFGSTSVETGTITAGQTQASSAVDVVGTDQQITAGVGAGVHATAKDQISPGMISAPVFDTQAAPDVVQTREKVTQKLVTVDGSGKSLINKNDPVATKPIETPVYQSTTSIPKDVVSFTDTATTVSSVQTTNAVSQVDTVNVVSSVGTKNVPAVDASVSSSITTGQSSVSSYVDTGPSQRELQMIARERKAQNDIQELIRQQREELRRLEDQKREHQRQLMLEKQRVEYEKQQLSLRKQQMEIEAMRKEQIYQRQLMEAQRKQMQADRLRMEQDRLAAIELAKKKAAEEERLRLEKERLKAGQERQRQAEIAFQRAQQERMMQLEFQKQQEIELARQQAIAEEKKRLEQEQLRKAEIAKQKALEAEKRRLEEERKKQAAAEEARMLAEIQAAMIAEEKAIAERAAADKAAREKAAAEKAAAEKAAAEKAKKAAPKNMTSTDAAWQAVLAAAGVTGSQPTDLAALMGGSGAAGMGMDPAALLKFLNPPSTPAPIITTPKPRKIPIRPDPKTRREVRQIFLDNMKPGVDPLSILIGLTPEKLMRSGVNPVIANSADLARIVPATERALGIQIKMLPTPGMRGSHPRGAVGHPSAMRGGAGLGGLPPPTSGSSRRQFMIEQRMMNEMMQLFGLGPEPLEPGDPGYQGPGQTTGGPGGAAAGPGGPGGPGVGRSRGANPFEMTDAQQIAMERRMGAQGGFGAAGGGMGGMGPEFGGMGGGVGGAAGAAQNPMMEMLGL